MPRVYQIEVTNACNLTCDFCPKFTPWNKRPIGMMDPRLVDLVDWSETGFTELQFTGEPLLHKHLIEIIKRVKSYGVKVGFSTNGTFKDRLAKALEYADLVTVNDDEFRDPVFEDRHNVVVQQLGVTYEIEDYSRAKAGNPPPCVTPYDTVSIQWNGDVVPCCKDHGGHKSFGNLYVSKWDEVMESPARKAFLSTLSRRERNGLCEFCSSPNPHKIHEKLVGKIGASL